MLAKGLNMNIVLLTDFGYQDGFVGVMKGIIKSLSPHCNLIDLAHSVPDYDILRGALLLEAHYSYFPKGTIFLCVIDPSVGGDRQPIIVKSGGYYFVGGSYRFLNDQAFKPLNIGPMAGILKNKLYFAYSYQITINDLSGFNSGTHSITIGLNILQGLIKCPCTLGTSWRKYRAGLNENN